MGEETDIDNLEAILQQLFGFVGEVMRHAAEGCRVGLVDVHAADGTAEGGRRVGSALADVLGLAADGMIKNEDPGCASSVQLSISRQSKGKGGYERTYASLRSCSVSG